MDVCRSYRWWLLASCLAGFWVLGKTCATEALGGVERATMEMTTGEGGRTSVSLIFSGKGFLSRSVMFEEEQNCSPPCPHGICSPAHPFLALVSVGKHLESNHGFIYVSIIYSGCGSPGCQDMALHITRQLRTYNWQY